jgi:hypothetical protein
MRGCVKSEKKIKFVNVYLLSLETGDIHDSKKVFEFEILSTIALCRSSKCSEDCIAKWNGVSRGKKILSFTVLTVPL